MRFDYIFKHTTNVRECQVVQESVGEIRCGSFVETVMATPMSMCSGKRICRWIGPRLAVQFEYVREIEREANGKYRAVKSLLRPAPGPGPTVGFDIPST
jgi:phenylacetate-CoA ligase